MAGDWEVVPLDCLIEPTRGISYGIVQPGAHVDDGVPIVRVSDVRDGRIAVTTPLRVSPSVEAAYARTRLSGGELLLTLVGTVGEAAVVPASLAGWNTARAVAVIPVRKDVGAYWVKLALGAPGVREIIDSRLNTTVQATLNLGDVARLPIALPPIREREAIAHVLGTLDEKIELNRRMNETLEGMARALFTSWFVDFDPVRAKAEGRESGLPKPLADLFPDSFEESELGEIPKGWGVGTIGTLADRIIDKVTDPADWAEEHLIDLSRMPQRAIALSEWGLGDELTTSVTSFRARDTLFGAIRPYFHKVGIAPVAGVTNISVFVIRPKTGTDWPFVAMFCSMGTTVDSATRVAKGTKMPVVSWTDFAKTPLVVPTNTVRLRFNEMVGPLLNRLIANVIESRTLAATRDALLPKLISGELRIKDPKDFFERSSQ